MSDIFSNGVATKISSKLKAALNNYTNIQLGTNLKSTRATGDYIIPIIKKEFGQIIANEKDLFDFKSNTNQKSMYNFSFRSSESLYYIDVMTVRTDKKFSMPNICSVQKLLDLYRDKSKYFCPLIIKYNSKLANNCIEDAIFDKLENFNVENIAIQNLGLGQIQFKKSKDINIKSLGTRTEWLEYITEKYFLFLSKLIDESNKRIIKVIDYRDNL